MVPFHHFCHCSEAHLNLVAQMLKVGESFLNGGDIGCGVQWGKEAQLISVEEFKGGFARGRVNTGVVGEFSVRQVVNPVVLSVVAKDA